MAKTLDYEPKGDGMWHPRRGDAFEDDAFSPRPSFAPRDDSTLGPARPVGVIGFFRVVWRTLGYALVFILYALIFMAASLAAGIVSGASPNALPSAVWSVGPVITGCIGVWVQMRINRLRRSRARR